MLSSETREASQRHLCLTASHAASQASVTHSEERAVCRVPYQKQPR